MKDHDMSWSYNDEIITDNYNTHNVLLWNYNDKIIIIHTVVS